jgi:hypothetical protein
MGSCASAAAQRRSPDLDAVPLVAQFDKAWLTAALRRSAVLAPGAAVTAMTVGDIKIDVAGGEALENGGGLAGGKTVRFTDITYGGGAGGAPSAMVEKWLSTEDGVLQRGVAGLLERAFTSAFGIRCSKDRAIVQEPRVYNKLRQELAGVGVGMPAVYYAASDGAADAGECCFVCCRRATAVRGAILLEDLKASGCAELGHVILDYGSALAPEVYEAALQTMARVHGWGWGGRGRGERYSGWVGFIAGQSKLVLKFVHPKFGGNGKLQQFLDVWGGHPAAPPALARPEVVAMLWDLRANVASWLPRARAIDRDQTLLHGDFHRGNLFWRAERNELVVIDWAMFGAGHVAWELGYFLVVTPSAAHDWARGDGAILAAILGSYHAELCRVRPATEREYSLSDLEADVGFTLALLLIMLLDDKAKPDKLAESEAGLASPGLGQRTAELERALLDTLLVYFERRKRDAGTSDVFFSGARAPERAEAEAEAARAGLQAKVAASQAKRAREKAAKEEQKSQREAAEVVGGSDGLGAGLLASS